MHRMGLSFAFTCVALLGVVSLPTCVGCFDVSFGPGPNDFCLRLPHGYHLIRTSATEITPALHKR